MLSTHFTLKKSTIENTETAVGTSCSTQGAKFHFQIGPLKLQFASFKKSPLYDRQLVGAYVASSKAARATVSFFHEINENEYVFYAKHSFTLTRQHMRKTTKLHIRCVTDCDELNTSLRESYKLKAAFGGSPKHEILKEL